MNVELFDIILCDSVKLYDHMERTWGSMSKKLNKRILTAVTELSFEQMTPVQVESRSIAQSCALKQCTQLNVKSYHMMQIKMT